MKHFLLLAALFLTTVGWGQKSAVTLECVTDERIEGSECSACDTRGATAEYFTGLVVRYSDRKPVRLARPFETWTRGRNIYLRDWRGVEVNFTVGQVVGMSRLSVVMDVINECKNPTVISDGGGGPGGDVCSEFTPGSVYFAGSDGCESEDPGDFYYSSLEQSLRIGNSNPPSNTQAGLLVAKDYTPTGGHDLIVASATEDTDTRFAKLAIRKQSGGGIAMVYDGDGDASQFNMARHASTWPTPTNASSAYAGMMFRISQTSDVASAISNRPWYQFTSGTPSGSTDYVKWALTIGMAYTDDESASTHRGGTFMRYPAARNGENHYSSQVPNSIAYYNDLGILLRSTPDQLQVTNPTDGGVDDLSVVLDDIVNTGGGGAPTWITEEPVVNAGTNTVVLTVAPELLEQVFLYIGGQKIRRSQLSLTGSTITLNTYTLNAGDIVEVQYVNYN